MKQGLNSYIKNLLDEKLLVLEDKFSCDVIWYFWEIVPTTLRNFRDFIEEIANNPVETHENKKRLVIILNTPWGNVEAVEKMVDIIRFHYNEVYFIVPDFAMSAWTIFCMSWDKIFMDYTSSLWPIDPQIFSIRENRFVPALWYLDKVEELVEKSREWKLTQAELIMLQSQDLAMLKQCEQAKNLSIKLLKERLVEYKFKTWTNHRSWEPVTHEEKLNRAEEIANKLSDNKEWSSHSRFIKIDKLEKIIKLKIDDYSNDPNLRNPILEYHDLMTEFLSTNWIQIFLHSRMFF